MKKCRGCGKPISQKRLEALPHTRVCVGCSQEQPVKGHMITPHKTGSHIQIVSAKAHEYIQSVNHRGAYGANLPTENKKLP
jgi:hypothetical protein